LGPRVHNPNGISIVSTVYDLVRRILTRVLTSKPNIQVKDHFVRIYPLGTETTAHGGPITLPGLQVSRYHPSEPTALFTFIYSVSFVHKAK